MEESSGIAAASLPAEATNSSAGIMIPMSAAPTDSTPMSPTFSPTQQLDHPQIAFPNTPGQAEGGELKETPSEAAAAERTIPVHELRAMLRQQLEYYFSRENLATDAYLRSQMDGDQYVPIATIAKFNQIRRLTEDLNLIVEALRDSPYVQVDDTGEKVRPSQRSIVLILREIPETTPLKELEDLFSGENCPMFSRCEFAHNDTWYVLFNSDEDAKKAYCYLREVIKTFNGKPIMARIKASLTSAPYSHHSYKNGVVSPSSSSNESYNSPQLPQPQQAPQPPQQTQQQPQPHVQYTYANVPSENYSNQQICPPFYPPTMLQTWAPTTAACVDLGAVFQMNGLSPQPHASYRLSSANKANYPGRERQMKAYNLQQSYLGRSDQSNRYYSNRSQSSFLQRQQQQQQQQQQAQQSSFHNLVNTTGFDYMPYASAGARSLQFGIDMNFFAAPPANVCLSRMTSQRHSSYQASQTRHSALLLPRNQMAAGAINSQDQSYIPAVCTGVQFSKEASGSSKQGSDPQGKENWGTNQKSSRNKRWSKENGSNTCGRQFSETSNSFNKSVNGTEGKSESPKFDLETASFPPLPGCTDTDVMDVDVFESKVSVSDIVKGVKPSTRDSKTQTSESSMVNCALMKDISTLTIEDSNVSSDGAFTSPACAVANDGVPAPDYAGAHEKSEWREPSILYSDLCSNSISTMTQTLSESFSSNCDPAVSVAVNSVPPRASLHETPDVPTSAPPNPEVQPAEKHVKGKSKQTPADAKTSNNNSSKPSDLISPKSNKTPESSPKAKDGGPKEPAKLPARSGKGSFSNKLADSSSSNRPDSLTSASSDVFSPKENKPPLGHHKANRSFDLPKLKDPESLLSVNGHVDSESTLSSEDEKPSRKLTYSEVAIRAKDKMEKMAQELKEKERRQEAMVRQHHRQQDVVTQSKQSAARGEFSARKVSDRPSSANKDWRAERRKPTQTVSLSLPGQ